MNKPGKVYLVGAGPGDEGLLTVRGAELLGRCDCIVYDSLASEKLLAYGREDCEYIFVGKRKGHHLCPQEEINACLIRQARMGREVVRLKGGDPFVFGRGGEEVLALQEAGIAVEVVPGVTSVTAVLAAAGIPVTHRRLSRSIHVFTGHAGKDGALPEDFYRLGNCGGTVVCLMGLTHLKEIVGGLIRQGWRTDTPAAVIQNGTLPGQREVFGTLEDIERKAGEAGIGTPAVIVAGETAGLRLWDKSLLCRDLVCRDSHLSLSEPLDGGKGKQSSSGALTGVRVGITGTPYFTGKLKRLLEAEGAEVETMVQLFIRPLNQNAVEQSYDRLNTYHWLVFTSVNGVRQYLGGFFRKNGEVFRDVRGLGRLKIAVIGEGTKKALEEFHLHADYMPRAYTGKALGQGLAERVGENERVLLARAKQGSKELTDALDAAHIVYEDLTVYDVEAAADVQNMQSVQTRPYDFLTFASASGVRAFFSGNVHAAELAGQAKLCCIGALTAEALKKEGYAPECIAEETSAEGIAGEIIRACSGRQNCAGNAEGSL